MDVCCAGRNVGYLAPVARAVNAEVFHSPLRPTLLGFCRQLQHILRAGRYDILHIHLDTHSGPAVWVGRRLDLPVIVTFHNTRFPPHVWWAKLPLLRQLRQAYGKFSINYSVKHADLVTGVSNAVLDSVCADREVPPARTCTLHLGCPTPVQLSPQQSRSYRDRLSLPANDPLILHVGRFCAAKNHLGLLTAFGHVLEKVPNARLVLVGDGPLRTSIQTRAGKYGLAGSVHFLGLRDDVTSVMQSCDVFLFPSFHEGLPIVLMESLAAGLPVVASRIAGITEVVEDRVTGLLHDVQDVRGMAESVVKVLRDADYRRKLAEASKRRHATWFSIEAAADRLTTLYGRVLEMKSLSNTGEVASSGRTGLLPAAPAH